MISIGFHLSVGFSRADTECALALARSGRPAALHHQNGSRAFLDPEAKTARLEITDTHGTTASAELTEDAFDAICRSGDGDFANVGFVFPVLITLAQGAAIRHALDNAEELAIEHASGRMAVGRDGFVTLSSRMTLPDAGPDGWVVSGALRCGGDARAALLGHLTRAIAQERARN